MSIFFNNYYFFFKEVTKTEKPSKFTVFVNRRFMAFLLLYFGSQTSWLPRGLKLASLLVLRFFFAIESSSKLIVKGSIFFPHPRNIIIGASEIDENVIIYQNVTIGAKRIDFVFERANRPKIGKNCIICTGSVIVGGGMLKPNTIVSANELLILN